MNNNIRTIGIKALSSSISQSSLLLTVLDNLQPSRAYINLVKTHLPPFFYTKTISISHDLFIMRGRCPYTEPSSRWERCRKRCRRLHQGRDRLGRRRALKLLN